MSLCLLCSIFCIAVLERSDSGPMLLPANSMINAEDAVLVQYRDFFEQAL